MFLSQLIVSVFNHLVAQQHVLAEALLPVIVANALRDDFCSIADVYFVTALLNHLLCDRDRVADEKSLKAAIFDVFEGSS